MTKLDWGEERSRTVTWHEPRAVAAHGATLSGQEYLRAVMDGEMPPPPISQLFNQRITAIGDGTCTFRIAPDESAYNPIGMIHGGLLCTLLDSAAGCAVHTQLPAGTGYTSIEIKVNYMRPIHSDAGEIEATGTVIRLGRRVAFAEAEAHTLDGKLVGSASSSLLIFNS